MSYVIIPAGITDTQLPYGVTLQFSEKGVFTTAFTREEQALANFKNLLLTYPGERTGDWINFGCGLKEIIFEPIIDEIKPDIQDLITSATAQWLPYINIQQINITTAEDDPSLQYFVSIAITFTVSGLREQTLTINTTNSGNITIE